jgi:S1-C subfamily serine protease
MKERIVLAMGLLAGFGLGMHAPSATAGGWLGVTIEPVKGVLVGEIIKGSPADQIGLQKGDVILTVNRKEIDSVWSFTRIITSKPPGTQVSLGVQREGQLVDLTTTLDDSNKHMSVPHSHGWPWAMPGSNWSIPSVPEGGMMPGQTWGHRRGSPWSVPPERADPDTSAPLDKGDPLPLDSVSEDEQSRAWLGLAMGQVPNGVAVLRVASASPAEKGGLRPGDVITKVNDQVIDGPGALAHFMATRKAGERITMHITRGSQKMSLGVDLTQRPPEIQ